MIRKLLDQAISGLGASASNLYQQGLNITARFDFLVNKKRPLAV